MQALGEDKHVRGSFLGRQLRRFANYARRMIFATRSAAPRVWAPIAFLLSPISTITAFAANLILTFVSVIIRVVSFLLYLLLLPLTVPLSLLGLRKSSTPQRLVPARRQRHRRR